MIIVSREEKETLLEAGRRLALVLQEVSLMVSEGVSTEALNQRAEEIIKQGGDIPSFLGYSPERGMRPYPATLCVSINDEVVHGIPNENPKIIKKGDLVSLDCGLIHRGVFVDSALTVSVGSISESEKKLMETTQKALYAGISAARVGGRIGDISHAIQQVVEGSGFSIVKVLGGHGVGKAVHEEPFIANFGTLGTGEEIVEGMVLALEPIATNGKGGVTLSHDQYTFTTKDGSQAAHFEHTILIESSGTTVVTKRADEGV